MEKSISFKAEAKIFASALSKAQSLLNSVESSKVRAQKNPTLEESCTTVLKPASQMSAKLDISTRKRKNNVFARNKDLQCSSQSARNTRSFRLPESKDNEGRNYVKEVTLPTSKVQSIRQQKLKTAPPNFSENSQLNSNFIKMNLEKEKYYFNSNDKKTKFIQSTKVFRKEPEKLLVSSSNLPFSCKPSKQTEESRDLQSSLCASSMLTTNSDIHQENENNTNRPLFTNSLNISLVNVDNKSSVHELKNHSNQHEVNSEIFSKAVSLLSVSDENLNRGIENHAHLQNSNQTQDKYLVKTSFNASPMSSNSSGYCSTPQSSSFLESENDSSSSLLSTSSSYSLSNNSLDGESVTTEYNVPSNFDNQYLGANDVVEKVEFCSPAFKESMQKFEKQISHYPSKLNSSTSVEPILSGKMETKPTNEKLNNLSLLKNSTERYVNKRNTNKPQTFYNFSYKPETDIQISQHSHEKDMLYIYDENNKNTDSTKWETFISSRPKSQLQSCSSQRYKATDLQKKPTNPPVSTENLKIEYSVHHLLSFNEETFIDTHCHLDYFMDRMGYKETFTDYRREFSFEFPPSYGGCVTVFCNPFSFGRTLQWKKLLSDEFIWAAFGCHPKNADHYCDSIEDDLCTALSHPRVRALGEIGLDYSERSTCLKSKQKEVFRRQINIGLAFELPLVIHCRDAYEDCLEILKEIVPQSYSIHLHCFTSEWSVGQKYLNAFPNLCIGVTNIVTFRNSWKIQEVVKNIPLDRLLLETDAPYFIPDVLSKKFKVSHPGMAIFVAAKVASLKNIPLKNVLTQTRKNTKKIYKI